MPNHGFENGRERAADYVNICNNIADSYPLGPVHGFQKDVIQNALDAKVGRGPVQLRIEHLITDCGEFLVATDSHTCGLTGPYVSPEQYDEDLPEDYHWARFEGFAFTKHDPDALGARGQGKFILMHASSEYLMYYDTLRGDGIYRFGGTQALRTGCPILPRDPFADPWEGSRGVGELWERCRLLPLECPGSRVIVARPRPEHVDALRSGELASYVSETWFRALEKRQLVVTLAVDGEETTVGLESPYPLPTEDRGDTKVWTLGRDYDDDQVSLSDGSSYRVKKFEIVRLAEPVDEDLRGVAIVQNGMKIESREMTSVPLAIADCIVGFIEFDTPLDRELRKSENQNPNHYSLHWRSRVPRAIKAYMEKQMEEFGRAKLGLARDPRQERQRRQSAAEEAALREISRFARDLDIFGRRRGITPPPPPPPPPNKLMGVSIHGFTYPDPETAPRVERGTEFGGVSAEAYNRTDVPADVVVAVRVLHGDRLIETLVESQHVSVASDPGPTWPLSLVVDGKYVDPGEYRLRVTMDDAETGARVDEVARRFWVDADPPFRAPFDAKAARGFPEPHHHRQWMVSGYIGTATVYYNVLHPAFIQAEQAEELQEYLLDIFMEAAIELVLNRPNLENGDADYHPLEAGAILPTAGGDVTDVPLRTYQEVMRYVSDFRWRALEG
jgi:hypothetical protein